LGWVSRGLDSAVGNRQDRIRHTLLTSDPAQEFAARKLKANRDMVVDGLGYKERSIKGIASTETRMDLGGKRDSGRRGTMGGGTDQRANFEMPSQERGSQLSVSGEVSDKDRRGPPCLVLA